MRKTVRRTLASFTITVDDPIVDTKNNPHKSFPFSTYKVSRFSRTWHFFVFFQTKRIYVSKSRKKKKWERETKRKYKRQFSDTYIHMYVCIYLSNLNSFFFHDYASGWNLSLNIFLCLLYESIRTIDWISLCIIN